jgi:hypothetical protein
MSMQALGSVTLGWRRSKVLFNSEPKPVLEIVRKKDRLSFPARRRSMA